MKVLSNQITKKYNNNLSFKMNYEIIRLPNVPDAFVKSIDDSLKSLPDEWGKELQSFNYKIYCANEIKDVLTQEGLPPQQASNWDALTCSHPHSKFFVFTPKIEPKDAQKVVNHEISHGIVDVDRLMINYAVKEALLEDSLSHKNYKINFKNIWSLKNLLCRYLDDYRQNEIIADTLAWQQPGGGLWGSGYKKGAKKPDFLKINFPTVHKLLADYKIDKDLYQYSRQSIYNDLPF